MLDLANLVYTPANVREMDRLAIEESGIAGYTLMSRAGEAAFGAIRSRYPDARRWLVLCGAGNNAGDGYVIAGLARAAGLDVVLAALTDPHRLTGDAARAWKDYRAQDGGVVQFSEQLCSEADVIVDAMLGTGLDRALEGNYLHAVETVAKAAPPTVAVDIPTGLNGTTGAVMGAAVSARLTITFVGLKQGLYLGVGPDHVGEIYFEDLGVPLEVVAHVPPAMRIFSPGDLAELLPMRSATAHKGRFGHVLVIGGNHGMAGAARLAGEAALRAGAGLVTVATRPENVVAVTGNRPELMARGVSGGSELAPLLGRATVVALGPGLGQDEWAEAMFHAALDAEQAKVLDADALNLLAAQPQRRDDWILTPHPGEAARLLNCSTSGVQADRLGAVHALTDRYGGAAVLKGRCTLICEAAKLPFVIDRGNPGMASAGMGDVLTGITAGLLAQAPQQPLGSAAGAAFAHAFAGDCAAADGQRGLIATDLLPFVRQCLNPST